MLEIIGFSFKNFKGLIDAKVTFADKNWSVIPVVGLNESGKTTLLEAIYMLLVFFKESNNVFTSHFLHTCTTKNHVENDKIIYLSFEIPNSHVNDESINKVIEFLKVNEKLNYKEDKLRITCEINLSNFQINYKPLFIEINDLPINIEFPKIVGFSPIQRDFGKNVKEIIPNTYFFSSKETCIGHTFNPDVKRTNIQAENEYKFFEKLLNYANITNPVLLYMFNRDEKKDLNKAKEKINIILKKVAKKVSELVFKIYNITSSDTKSEGFSIELDFENELCVLKLKRSDLTYYLNDLSEGIRWIVTVVLITEILLKDSENVLLILDEPGNHLHPNAQEILINYIIRSIGNNRLIYSTHSHHMIPRTFVDDVIVVKNSLYNNLTKRDVNITIQNYSDYTKDNGTNEKNTKDGSSRKSYTDPILKLLQYSRSELECQPKVIITEGKSDYFVLDYLLEIIKEKNQGKYTINYNMLRPGTGAKNTVELGLQCQFYGLDYLVIVDSDTEGNKAIKELERQQTSKARLFKLGDIIASKDKKHKKITCIEDLFEEDDFTTLKSFIPALNEIETKDCSNQQKKDILRIGMRKLLQLKRYKGADTNADYPNSDYPLSELTISRFEKIFDFIEEQFTTGIKKREYELEEIELKKEIGT